MRNTSMLRSITAACLLSVMALAAPAFAADASWKKAEEVPSKAAVACETKLKADGYSIAQTIAGREIERFVDLRYRVLKQGQDKFMVCRYDTTKEKTTVVKESKVTAQQ